MSSVHSFKHLDVKRDHDWVTVVNPTNRRMLLQACDNCGVVKSENTVIQGCKKSQGRALITNSFHQDLRETA